jgi:hypothetical protein
MSGLPFDFSKPPHPKTVDLILPLLPGLFFEVSILWADPALMTILTSHAAFNASLYARSAMALFCAYFIGLAVLVTLGFLQSLMKTSFRLASLMSASIKKRVYTYTGKRVTDPRSFARRFISPIQNRWIRRDMEAESIAHDAYQVWAHAAERLLSVRYGISPPPPTIGSADRQMGIWHDVLGTPTAEEIRGSSFLRAMHGSGWLGLVATQIAPVLWNRYYLGLSIALVVQGLVNDLFVSRNWSNRVYDIEVRIRCVLRDIPLVNAEAEKTEAPDKELPD